MFVFPCSAQCPDGTFLRNISGHNATINALAINRDNVLVSGADNGSLWFWDYKSGHSFQQHQTPPQPGSLDAEAGIFAMTFDQTGSRLLTAETDKTVKIYKEDENAVSTTTTQRRDMLCLRLLILLTALFVLLCVADRGDPSADMACWQQATQAILNAPQMLVQ